MAEDMAYLFAVLFGYPIVGMAGVMLGWAVIETFLTVLRFPWRNRR